MVSQIINQPSDELLKRERIIQSGLNTFYAVGVALSEIKTQNLFLATHNTWDDYCRERWQMASRTAYQAIKSSAIVSGLIASGIDSLPKSESVARELISIPESQRKEAWLSAISEMPDVTADQLKRWLRKRYHVKETIQKAVHVQRCPNCSCEFPMQQMASKSRGNRLPSKTPAAFSKLFGSFGTAIDYGCGRMRNAMAIQSVAESVIFTDLPEQIERVHTDGRQVLPVPLDVKIKAQVVFLIQVAHIQSDNVMAKEVIKQASAHATEYLVIDYPSGQFNHAKESAGYLRLTDEIIKDALPGWEIAVSRWVNKVNKMVVLHKCAKLPLLSNLFP